jgi:hypothetical protein
MLHLTLNSAEGRDKSTQRICAFAQSLFLADQIKGILQMDIIRGMLARQFGASVQMLHATIENCPEQAWTKGLGGAPFWHVAYHTIFFLDFYLHKQETDFTPAPFHREDIWNLDAGPASPEPAVPLEPYSKATLLEYLKDVRKRAQLILAELTEDDLTAPSPVPWYTIQRGDFLLNNLRHVQHHVSQLNMILRAHGATPAAWCGVSEL